MRRQIINAIGIFLLFFVFTTEYHIAFSQNVIITRESTRQRQQSPRNNQRRQSTKPTTGSIDGHEWVDLGLSVKWATCNVGAFQPIQFGDYFAWGETSSRDEFHCLNSLTRNNEIPDFSGNSSYDAATANWGDSWRTPTAKEFEELLNNCTFDWINMNGAIVCKATSKKNGQSIIFPANGQKFSRIDKATSYHYSDGSWVCSWGYYWCSTPTSTTDNTNSNILDSARCCILYGEHFGKYCNHFMSYENRWVGLFIRPVTN